MVYYLPHKVSTAISSYFSAVQPLFIQISARSCVRSPRAPFPCVGEESGLPVLVVMVMVSLQKDVSPTAGRSTDWLSLSPEEQDNGVCIPGNGLGLKSRGFILLLPPVCYRFNSSSVSEEFWRGRGGGGKIYFKLSSSLIHILFVMYFYQQHFAIQLPLLSVIFSSKKM